MPILVFAGFVFLLISMSFLGDPNLKYYYVAWSIICVGAAGLGVLTAITGWHARQSGRGVIAIIIGVLAVPGGLLLGAYGAYAAVYYFSQRPV